MKKPAALPVLNKVFKKLAASELWQRLGFALVSTLLILVFVKIPIEKFKMVMEKGMVFQTNQPGFYGAEDIDNDGSSERISFYKAEGSGRLTLKINRGNGAIDESYWFMDYEMANNSLPVMYDIDFDGNKEFIFIALKNDSVFLNAVNHVKNFRVINELFIGEIENKVEQLAFISRIVAFDDFNKDGDFELWFYIDSGHGHWPRGLFRYDMKSKTLRQSPKGYIPWSIAAFDDINKDGVPEILPVCNAPSNIHFETRYSDNNPWLTVFDSDLNFCFEPISFPAGYGTVSTIQACFNDTLILSFYNSLNNETDYNELLIVDLSGKIHKRKKFYRFDLLLNPQKVITENNKNYLCIQNVGRFEINEGLENLPEIKIRPQKNYKNDDFSYGWKLDVDQDGKEESINFDVDNSVMEMENGGLGTLTKMVVPYEGMQITGIYPMFENKIITRLMVATPKGYFFINYFKNKNYRVKYLIWLSIFFAAYTFTFLIQLFQRRRMEAKWATEKQLTELQFNTIRNQLNPHFIFNALNSVGYLIENGKKEEAYDYLSINARMIRKVLEDAEMTTRSIEEEINFVKDYLFVQEFRFKDRFVTEFIIDEKVDLTLAVPKMVLHTYVENAVKHGFKNTYSGGILEIMVQSIHGGILLIVRDNGKSETETDHELNNTGKGLNIMESYYKLFEKQLNCKIQTTFKSFDGTDASRTGTEVTVQIEY